MRLNDCTFYITITYDKKKLFFFVIEIHMYTMKATASVKSCDHWQMLKLLVYRIFKLD